jgi:leucyl-tRNA synthetase
VLTNSGFLDGLEVEAAKARAIAELEKRKMGVGKTIYRLRDWGISRQRYWGCPVPVIHCAKCGIVPVPDKDLPVTLPPDVDFKKPGNPIANHPTWKNTTCPTCGGAAERETDTFDTFFESSWYQFRYCDPKNEKIGFAKDKVSYWAPVDQYVGGVEHAVMHLLYARFFTRALKKCGYLDFDEPFKALFTQGMVIHDTFKDKDGKWLYPEEVGEGHNSALIKLADGTPVTKGRIEKMSKSKKNVIGLQAVSDSYGVDAARLLVLSDSPPERDVEWTTGGIEGAWKYVGRLYRLVVNADFNGTGGDTKAMRQRIHQTIDLVTQDFERFHFNKAIARLRELSNALEDFSNQKGDGTVLREGLEAFTILVNPLMPHLAEELWEKLGHSTSLVETPWPKADAELAANDTVTIAIQVNGKLRATITMARDLSKDEAEAQALADPAVQKALEGKTAKKVIVVPNRIVNVVV